MSLTNRRLYQQLYNGIMMNQPIKIISIASVLPAYRYHLDEVLSYAQLWVSEQAPQFKAKVKRIFTQAKVDYRHTVIPLEQIFAPMTLDEKNRIYQSQIIDLSEKALIEALRRANLNASDIDCLITTSCTGHMSPSLEAHLINRLNMKPIVQRLPVMEMGCIGGIAGLIYAENYLRAYPEKYVALISAELSSVTFQRDDFSWANIISAAIFGDGAACAILGPTTQLRPCLKGSLMYHFPETIDLLGFNLSSTGFRMVLDPDLPDHIQSHFEDFTDPLLSQFGITLDDIHHFIVHPGGIKILQNIAKQLPDSNNALHASTETFRELGNLSSATVLFILERILKKPIEPQSLGLMMGFGPGLTAGSILLEWQGKPPHETKSRPIRSEQAFLEI